MFFQLILHSLQHLHPLFSAGISTSIEIYATNLLF